MNTKEIETSMSTNQIINKPILPENNFDIIVNEMVIFLDNIETERKEREIHNYFNNHNIISQEIYNWLLNNQDNSYSIVLLGTFNHFGIEISVNEQKAFELYRKAANLENPHEISSLGNCCQYGIGIGVDKQKAFELYQEAANLGNARGINNLGYCYHNGVGTSVNKEKAFELYQKAANLGNTNGINSLGYCYQY